MRSFTKSTTGSDYPHGDTPIKLQLNNFAAQTLVGVDDILEQIDRLPAFHLQRLKEIVYDPLRLLQKYLVAPLQPIHRDAQGAFIQSHRTIAIHEIRSRHQFFHVLFHELGHHVYFQVIGGQLKKQWVTQIRHNQDCISKYAQTNAAEDFAECYASYLLNPDALKTIPVKFNFLKQRVFNDQCYLLQDDRIDFSA